MDLNLNNYQNLRFTNLKRFERKKEEKPEVAEKKEPVVPNEEVVIESDAIKLKLENYFAMYENIFAQIKKESNAEKIDNAEPKPINSRDLARFKIHTSLISRKKTESFWDVRKEMDEKVPDSTRTIEEKELAIKYIKRMLNCKDIPEDAKKFWENQLIVIEIEIQTIKNEELKGSGESYIDVAKEFHEFVDSHRNISYAEPDFNAYGYVAYYSMCISFLERILACNDIPAEERTMLNYELIKGKAALDDAIAQLNAIKAQFGNNNDTVNNSKGYREIYDDLNTYVEVAMQNLPDRSNIEEYYQYLEIYKKTCISYFEKMLNCPDIGPKEREHVESQINYLLRDINYGKVDMNRYYSERGEKTESYRDVLNEARSTVRFDARSLSEKELVLSFINRMLSCDDIPITHKATYLQQKETLEREIEQLRKQEEG